VRQSPSEKAITGLARPFVVRGVWLLIMMCVRDPADPQCSCLHGFIVHREVDCGG